MKFFINFRESLFFLSHAQMVLQVNVQTKWLDF